MNTLWTILRFVVRQAAPRRWVGFVRRLSLLLLLAAGVWLGGNHVVQWWFVGRLAGRLQVASDTEAPRLVHELARREGRAYQALVRAANSPRAAVALSARREIDSRVDRWQRESYLSPATFNLSATALPLARAFAKTSNEMSPSARRWARRVLEQLAEFAESQPIDVRLELLAQCDRALANLPHDDQAAVLADAGAVRLPIMLGGDPLTPKPTQASAVPHPPLVVTAPPQVEAPEEGTTSQAERKALEERFDWQRAAPLARLDGELPSEEPSGPVVETVPLTVPTREASLTRPARIPTQIVESALELPPPLAIDPTPWLEQLARGNVADQASAQERLHAAGYGQVRRDEALMYLSASLDDRKGLVNRILTSPRLEASAWLELLLADAAPEVRAATVAAIATSGDEKLLRRAEEVALHDPAPVVADQLPLLKRQLR